MVLPPIVFAGFVALVWVGMYREDPDALPSTMEGRAAPAVVVEPLGEGPVLSDAVLREAGVKLVNFWASWCAPCRAEHPMLVELAEGGVPVHGVNYKDKPENALGFLEELGDPFSAMGADASGRMGLDWGLYGVPETFVIDGDGEVVLGWAGPITRKVMDETIRPAIEKAAAE
jgi:cytochrome c biogenesis protein CcmG/thiol:disulfide interchange protein DsbE